MQTEEKRAAGNGARTKVTNTTRMEILDAGARLIVERGYEAFTMRAVASLVNVKAGSIYYHFSSKDEIVQEILNTGIARLLEYVQRVFDDLPSGTPLAARVQAAVMAHVSCMVGLHRESMQIYEHLPPVAKRGSRKMREKYARLWYELFADGVRRGEIDSTVNMRLLVPFLLGALNRIPEWLRTTGATAEDVAALTARVLLQGVGIGAMQEASPPPTKDHKSASVPSSPDLVTWAGDT